MDLTIQQAQPPEQVQAAFEDANKADQDRQRLINEGQAYANDVIPRARGTADRLLLEAQGYRDRVSAQAEGDALRFTQILDAYREAPDVTRERMYLETMQQIFCQHVEGLHGFALQRQPAVPAARQADAGRPRPAGSDRPEPRRRLRAHRGPRAGAPPPSAADAGARGNLRSRDRDAGR